MEKVQAIVLKNDEDVSISLSCHDGGDFGEDGVTIQRCYKSEDYLKPKERGACIGWDDEGDVAVVLHNVRLSREVFEFDTRGKFRQYKFDISDLSDGDFGGLQEHLDLINFDNSFKFSYQ